MSERHRYIGELPLRFGEFIRAKLGIFFEVRVLVGEIATLQVLHIAVTQLTKVFFGLLPRAGLDYAQQEST